MIYEITLPVEKFIQVITSVDPEWRHNVESYNVIFGRFYPSVSVRNIGETSIQTWKYVIGFTNEEEYTHFTLTYL